MSSTVLDMPKKKGPTETVRIPSALAQKARTVASGLGMSLPEYIEKLLRPAVARDTPKVIKLLEEEPKEDQS